MANTNSATQKLSSGSGFRKFFWPIEKHERKKFLPMALMMFCVLYNYSVFRAIKDGFVLETIGTESISFLKTYVVLPSAIIMMVLYAKLCNILNQKQIFITVTSVFIAFFAIFTFVLYPNEEFFHPNPELITSLKEQFPRLQWFIKIFGKWTFALFYAMSELWGSMMLSLLFWQFANHIIKTSEAKRFYSMFGVIGNMALPIVALMSYLIIKKNIFVLESSARYTPLLISTLFSGACVIWLYSWIHANVLTDPKLFSGANKSSKKKKPKLSLVDSFKMIVSSRYLGLIALLVLSYGVSINLVEGVWKDQVRAQYKTKEEITAFMSTFQGYQGVVAIIFMLVGSNILRRVSWKAAALFTPVMITCTGLIFFSIIVFDESFGIYVAALIGTGPVFMAVVVGAVQNILSKATKYSLFDSTKEMSYIPLDDEMKSKGKAAVDVIGGRFGKSGGGVIQSSFFMIFPYYSFAEATPFFASTFFLIVLIWVMSVMALSKEYEAKVDGQDKSDNKDDNSPTKTEALPVTANNKATNAAV